MNHDIKILLVDDDPDVLMATSRVIGAEGYQVFEASSGAECMELAKIHHPDLILLDVILPDIEGIELCNAIKSDPSLKKIFVILISGLRTSSIEQAEGLDVGADGYIARPVSNKELKARVKAFVRILSAERERDRLIQELQEALSTIKQLSGLLPICSHCKKIRDDQGYWSQLEAYIQKHSEAVFTHSICRECAGKLYPDLDLYDESK
ncbi:MAG: response regulator [Desulfohalobiaceae bacterium]|nr:response regulator [Desulfohalobiaceae bacterium]